MRRKLVLTRFGVALVGALMLGGCTSTLSSLPPAMGGLPADAPERPAEGQKLAYPAVHDMPPPRPTHVMTPAEVEKAEAEMARIRDGQGKPVGSRSR